jgi:RimJ/RimL family protein N-acetyltransferase
MRPTSQITIRCAALQDARRIWRLRDDPSARNFSGSTDPIPLDSHYRWFESKYFGPHAQNYCYVLEIDGEIAGYCRMDRDEIGNSYVVSIAVAEAFQGQGLGHALLSRTLDLFLDSQEHFPVIMARIRESNIPSIRLFEKNGFVSCGSSNYRLQQNDKLRRHRG